MHVERRGDLTCEPSHGTGIPAASSTPHPQAMPPSAHVSAASGLIGQWVASFVIEDAPAGRAAVVGLRGMRKACLGALAPGIPGPNPFLSLGVVTVTLEIDLFQK